MRSASFREQYKSPVCQVLSLQEASKLLHITEDAVMKLGEQGFLRVLYQRKKSPAQPTTGRRLVTKESLYSFAAARLVDKAKALECRQALADSQLVLPFGATLCDVAKWLFVEPETAADFLTRYAGSGADFHAFAPSDTVALSDVYSMLGVETLRAWRYVEPVGAPTTQSPTKPDSRDAAKSDDPHNLPARMYAMEKQAEAFDVKMQECQRGLRFLADQLGVDLRDAITTTVK